MKPPKTNKTKRVSKDQWLNQALDTLESSGVEAIKIERLAKGLGISRSGFYWHFKNRQDLLEHLLDYWVRRYTVVVTDNPDVVKLDPKNRLLTTMEMIRDKHLTKYDLAMTSWAKLDPQVHKVVRKVVKMRLDYLQVIFAELGFEGGELEMRTRLFVCYHSWEDTMFPDLSNQKHSKLLKLRYNYFIQK
ncbi:MAG: TetR/AcrR family transcriptional regulator [Deltaproteobacteria bacterium]|jgi:AcrR family transcriptional regulator|nr:TetR/AcrR family transcriptional regulator [Deltaproteobacteria bacterium]